jgi:hypothetical protein
MTLLDYRKAEAISLKNHPQYNERWLSEKISEDPSLLGLGDITLLDRERRQERAGRLDLLLADVDNSTRYEVELMLGATDESHIIRTIEYWDIERRRYPAYDHCAVLVAEDVTGRFLNLLGLFAGTIPLVVIQLRALKVGDQMVLDFVKVLDQRSLRRDDEVEESAPRADREYWLSRASVPVIELAESIVRAINEKCEDTLEPNYNKHFIGLTDGIRSNNFIHFRPRKQFLHMVVRVSEPAGWTERLEAKGLSAHVEDPAGSMRVTLRPGDLETHKAELLPLIEQAVQEDRQG